MSRFLIEEPIDQLCEKKADYKKACELFFEDEEPNAAEMKVFSRIEDKYMTALRESVLYLVDEYKTIRKSHKNHDALNQCDYTKCADDGETNVEYKLIIGKLKNEYHQNTGLEDQGYTFVVVPWNDNVALSLFKEKHRRIFYSSEAVDREVIDVRRYLHKNPTADEINDLHGYLKVLSKGADRMFEATVSPCVKE